MTQILSNNIKRTLELNDTEIDISKYDKNEEHVLVYNIHEGNNT